MTHPILPDRENTTAVFEALVATLPEEERSQWEKRWQDARAVERQRRDYDRKWDDAQWGATRWGQ